jgi:large subunit ribosomal protein L30
MNITITQIKSKYGRKKDHRETLRSLGLKGINSSVQKQENPAILGMIKKVEHLIKVDREKTGEVKQ